MFKTLQFLGITECSALYLQRRACTSAVKDQPQSSTIQRVNRLAQKAFPYPSIAPESDVEKLQNLMDKVLLLSPTKEDLTKEGEQVIVNLKERVEEAVRKNDVSLSDLKEFTKSTVSLLGSGVDTSLMRTPPLNAEEKELRAYFHELSAFIHFPFSIHTAGWNDRMFLQELIGTSFPTLFNNGDCVIFPGCADGQIPLLIQHEAIKHNISVHIIAADLNKTAMELGSLTARRYDMPQDGIHWAQADVLSDTFFPSLKEGYLPMTTKEIKVFTLLQPSVSSENLQKFLVNIGSIPEDLGYPTKIFMPLLIADPNSGWYKSVKKTVEKDAKGSFQKTDIGIDAMIYPPRCTFLKPYQHFIDPEAIESMLKKANLTDITKQFADPIRQVIGEESWQADFPHRFIRHQVSQHPANKNPTTTRQMLVAEPKKQP